MDVNGRLHMPGFVGQTFEETGVLKRSDEQKPVGNRKQRRAQQAIDRKAKLVKAGQTA